MKQVYFISGIDTDIGKSVAVGVLARVLQQRGTAVVTQKLVQTGDAGISMDIRLHRQLMGTGLLPVDLDGTTCPELFGFPASPHLAAELESRTVDVGRIDAATARLTAAFDVVLLEGAGGLLVPLTRDLMSIDFAAERGYPLILVTSGRLGSLNHTLLSLEAARRRHMTVAGVIYNTGVAADATIAADTEAWLRRDLVSHDAATWLARLGRVDWSRPEQTELSDVGNFETI